MNEIFKHYFFFLFFFFLYKKLFLENENEMESNNRQKKFSIVPDFVQLVNFFLNREAKGQNRC